MVEPSVVEEFAKYPFDADEAFQEGLSSILESLQTDDVSENREDIIGRAKAFYFSSVTGHQVSWEELRAPRNDSKQNDGVQLTQSDDHVLSFTEIMALIESDQAHLVPNNEHVPGGTTEELPSVSKAEPRRKPWETPSNRDSTEAV